MNHFVLYSYQIFLIEMSKPTISKILWLLIYSLFAGEVLAQNSVFPYAPSPDHPYGLPNPMAPAQISDYAEMIGVCDCQSTTHNSDGSWADTQSITWSFKYIMDGKAVQDETYKPDGTHTGSIRQYNQDSARWYVHFYTSAAASPSLQAWGGNRNGNEITLYNRQKAPNGMDGYYKIRFYDISQLGFRWLGVCTSLDEYFVYETWKIDCMNRS
jgi:hypothetical protein